MKSKSHFLVRNRIYIASSAFALIPFVPLVWPLLHFSFIAAMALIAVIAVTALVIFSMVLIGGFMRPSAKKEAGRSCLDAAECNDIPRVVSLLGECEVPPMNSIIRPRRNSRFPPQPIRFFDWVISRCNREVIFYRNHEGLPDEYYRLIGIFLEAQVMKRLAPNDQMTLLATANTMSLLDWLISHEEWDAAFVLFDERVKRRAISPDASRRLYIQSQHAGQHDRLSQRGVSFLNVAIMHGDVFFAMDLILRQHVDVNAVGLDDRAPLFVSIESNELLLMLLLVAKGAKMFRERSRWSLWRARASRLARVLGHSDMVAVLEKEEAYASSKKRSLDGPEMSLSKKSKMSSLDRYGHELLVHAIQRSYVCLEAFLCHHGVGIDVVNRHGETLLFEFMLSQELPLARSLIESGANVLNKSRNDGGRLMTPYELAASLRLQGGMVPLLLRTQRLQEKRQIATFLLSLGRLLRRGCVPFLPPEILCMIVDGFSLEIKGRPYQLIPGMLLTQSGHASQGRGALKRKYMLVDRWRIHTRWPVHDLVDWSPLPRVSQHGPRLLVHAVQVFDCDLVAYLVHSGVDIDAVCDEKASGYFSFAHSLTPLMRSLSKTENLRMTKLLIGLGASLTKKCITVDGRHLTPRQLLEEHMARSDPFDRGLARPMLHLLKSEEEWQDRARIITFLCCMARCVGSGALPGVPVEMLAFIVSICRFHFKIKPRTDSKARVDEPAALHVVDHSKCRNRLFANESGSARQAIGLPAGRASIFGACFYPDGDQAQMPGSKRSAPALINERAGKRFRMVEAQQAAGLA